MTVRCTVRSPPVPALTDAYLRGTGERILVSARARCPVRTGRLRDSLRAVTEGGTLTVGTDVPYGKYVECGTARRPGAGFLAGGFADAAASVPRR